MPSKKKKIKKQQRRRTHKKQQRRPRTQKKEFTNREGLTWLEWFRAATYGLSSREKKAWVIPHDAMRKDWKAGVDPSEWAASWRAEISLTAEEQKGIVAIIALQGLAKIKESEEDALAGWRAMTPSQKRQTLALYKELFGSNP